MYLNGKQRELIYLCIAMSCLAEWNWQQWQVHSGNASQFTPSEISVGWLTLKCKDIFDRDGAGFGMFSSGLELTEERVWWALDNNLIQITGSMFQGCSLCNVAAASQRKEVLGHSFILKKPVISVRRHFHYHIELFCVYTTWSVVSRQQKEGNWAGGFCTISTTIFKS